MAANNFEEGVQRAMILLKGVNSQQSPQPMSPQPEQGGNDDFESGVQRAMELLKNNENTSSLNSQNSASSQNSGELSLVDRALQFPRGIAEDYGDVLDLASESRQGHPTVMADLATNFEDVQRVPEGAKIPKVAPMITQKFDEIVGKDLTPTDDTGKFIQGAGHVFAPYGVPGLSQFGKGAKATIKAVGKALARDFGIGVGSSAATNLTPQMAEEGSAAAAGEDLVKAVGGGIVGANPVGIVKSLSKDNIKKLLARAVSLGTTPDPEVLRLAKEHGIDLPFNVGSNGRLQNFFANNVFNKSIFTSKKYEDVIKHADENMIKKFEESLETLGSENLKPTEGSHHYKTFLEGEASAVNKEKTRLYENANALLTEKDKLIPEETAKVIESLNSLLTRDIKSKPTKEVSSLIHELGQAWGIIPPGTSLEEFQKHPELVKKITAHFAKNSPEIDISRLTAVREELQEIYKHDPSVKGVKKQLSRLVGALTKDIQKTDNKAFLEKWEDANSFYKMNVAKRIESNLARSILNGEAPQLAISYLNNPQNIARLEKITGNSKRGKEIFNLLKKTKLTELLSNSFDNNGSMVTGNFAKMFKESKQAQQELLQSLLGKEQYNQLKDISKIAQSFSDSGKQLLNTSGTAITSSELKILGGLTGLSTVGGGLAGMGSGALSSAAYIGSINQTTKALSDPKFVNQMHAYALARQAGNEKNADIALKRVLKTLKTLEPESVINPVRATITEELSNDEYNQE